MKSQKKNSCLLCDKKVAQKDLKKVNCGKENYSLCKKCHTDFHKNELLPYFLKFKNASATKTFFFWLALIAGFIAGGLLVGLLSALIFPNQ